MTADIRHEVLGLQLGAGDHICGFYRRPSTRDDVLAKLSEQIEVEPYLSVSQLEVLDSYGTYLADGGFLPERMLRFWEAKARQSPQADGPGFARNIGDMSWAHRDERCVADLVGYESELNRIMSDFPQVNL